MSLKLSTDKLRELLVKPGFVGLEDFNRAVAESQEKKIPVEDVLLDQDLIQDNQLGLLVAENFGWRFIDLKREKIEPEIFDQIPELVARHRGAVALSRTTGGVKVGLTDPRSFSTIHIFEKRLGEKVLPYYLTPRALESLFANYRGSLKQEFEETVAKLKIAGLSRDERNESAIKLVDLLFKFGAQNKASDVHIEPSDKKVLVRFRIDGVMHDILEIPKDLSETIISRIKILAGMRTDEHKSAQDGKLEFIAKDNERVDVRVSIVPVTEGENVVLRLLSEQSRRFSLTDLGLGEVDLKKVKRAAQNPHGMILVTGPTGSGKTTSVYAVVKILNTRDVHIATIEDPVEYDVEGISQIQVNPRVNLTFATGLRAIVRQDPDIIVVGEIRDQETAGIAINSAMTGHLVLSTLHANDAVTTLPRLLDMGIEPFLVASTINVVIAQRLVRQVCPSCRQSTAPSVEQVQLIESEPEIKKIFKSQGYTSLKRLTFYAGPGCQACGGTGYQGRVGIFEILEMTEAIKSLVVARASASEILASAKKDKMTTMLEDGVAKILSGQTTLEEVLRVTKV